MLDSLFAWLAPHYCLSCGQIGRQICENCFFDIEIAPRQTCLSCHGILVAQRCSTCPRLAGVQQIVLAEREGLLGRLVDDYKQSSTRETHQLIARLFDTYAPHLPPDTHLVPVPTSPPHIRRRGFDHTHDITRAFARRRKLHYSPLLRRRHHHAQMGQTAATRRRQAATAFELARPVSAPDDLYVVCDDVVTTGSSVMAALDQLRAGGASRLAVVALMQQPWQSQR